MKRTTAPLPRPEHFSVDEPLQPRDRDKEHRNAVVTLLLIALALATGACVTGTIAARADTQLNAFRAAQPCTATQSGTRNAECLADVTATLKDQYVDKGKPPYPHVVLAGIASSPVDVTLPDTDGLFENVDPGGSLQVTLWEGKVVRISGGGLTESTLDVPVPSNVFFPLIGALFAGAYALLALYFTAMTLLARTIAGRFGRRPRLVDYPQHFAWMLPLACAPVFGVVLVAGARGPAALSTAFGVSALVAALGVAVIRPGEPPRPRRHPVVNLPSATTPFE